ncbi:MAG: hypothetical protein PHE26_08075 [Syntrophomonadaceae bacterium]|nr:hypothetical protein [Syntrophomonadaceae bacterium]
MNLNAKSAIYFHAANGSPGCTFQSAQQLAIEKQKLTQQRHVLQSQIMNTAELVSLIFRALTRQQGFSFIRLGDSELLILAQDLIFPSHIDISQWGHLLADLCCDNDLGEGDDEVSRWWYIVQVSGNQFPDRVAWEYLVKAVSTATIIGIPSTYRPGRSLDHMKLLEGFQTLFIKILSKLNIPAESLKLADSAEHHLLHASGWFRRLLLPNQYPGLCQQFGLPLCFQPRILLAGNLAAPFADLLIREGCNVAAVIQPVGMNNIEDVIRQIRQHSFDIALVSAGTAAKYICTCIAQHMGKIALDTGQLFDELLYEYGHLNHENYIIPFMSFM